MNLEYDNSGTLLAFKDDKNILELSNIDGHIIYDNINEKILNKYDKNTETHVLINNFIYECKIRDCEYISTGNVIVHTSNVDKLLHFNKYCNDIHKILLYDIEIKYNMYKYLKNINAFCDKCYIECFFNIL
ncbi:hypothetical protein AMV034 [Betaentomopoxvirus amoorei]|uniref:AMV034 n=1 Tax=Amsacta moorei entomopoxvirus TaxID=28321 RepID=Q9EN14_AMEPV|nr:hypothetical protein AMV034 [Amsacta moorei entomopoxvirus]AAG02740.1 AMV034 [Amsacta moorei entomopoxvirus]